MDRKLKSIVKKYSFRENEELKKGDLVFHPFIKGEKPVKVELVDGDMIHTSDGKVTKKMHVKKSGSQIKETAGFEKKGTKETNVEEDLRTKYETGELVPYQSVIAEGKIVGNSKIPLTEMPAPKKAPFKINMKAWENMLTEVINDIFEYIEEEYEPIPKKTIERELYNFLKGQTPNDYLDEMLELDLEEKEDEDGD